MQTTRARSPMSLGVGGRGDRDGEGGEEGEGRVTFSWQSGGGRQAIRQGHELLLVPWRSPQWSESETRYFALELVPPSDALYGGGRVGRNGETKKEKTSPPTLHVYVVGASASSSSQSGQL